MKRRLDAEAPSTRRAHGEVERAIEEIRSHGFCITKGSWKRDIWAVAVPMRDARTDEVYAFSCGAPSFLMSDEALRTKIGPRLAQAVAALSRDHGARRRRETPSTTSSA